MSRGRSLFSMESLGEPSFAWKTALSMAVSCKLSYQSADAIERTAKMHWQLNTCDFLQVGNTQCFVASSASAIFVTFRGTDELSDWIANLSLASDSRNFGTVHGGFLHAYESVKQPLRQMIANLGINNRRFLLTGHSLGGAIATIAAADLINDFSVDGIYTFGQPQLGYQDFRTYVKQKFGERLYRFVNGDDIVPRIPPGYDHPVTPIHFDDIGLLRTSVEESASTSPEYRSLDESEFRDLQESLERTKGKIRGTKETDAALEAATIASTEGIFSGFSNHKIAQYISKIQRFATEGVELEAALESARPYSVDVSETVRNSIATNRTSSGTPIVIRVRDPNWAPPTNLKIQSRIGPIVTAWATDEQIEVLRSNPSIRSIEASRDAGIQDCTVSMPFVGATQVQIPPIDERGNSAIVGVIDSGIDILHEAFLDANLPNPASRILAIWNQRDNTGQAPSQVDPTFTQDYGTYYDANEIAQMIAGVNPVPALLRDPGFAGGPGHGTHVSSIAAGKPAGRFAGGVAPEANLVVVIPNMVTTPGNPPSLGYSHSHIDALDFLLKASRKFNKPMAVNVSLGMNAGAHDGLSNLEAAFDGVTTSGTLPGFAIVKSAGNEGNSDGHAEMNAFNGVQDLIWNSSNDFRPQDYIEVWYDSDQDLAFKIKTPIGSQSTSVSVNQTNFSGNLDGNFVNLALTICHPDNGENLLQITIVPNTSVVLPGDWSLEITGQSVIGNNNEVHAWVERDQSRAVRFTTGNSNAMTLSVPGTALRIITVAACGSVLPLQLLPESSQGLTRDLRAKPDLCAPGIGVIAAASNSNDHKAVVAMSGTSQSAPHVTGAVALAFSLRAKSGKSQLNANQIRRCLTKTAKNSNGTHHERFGFGALDIAAFISEIVALP